MGEEGGEIQLPGGVIAGAGVGVGGAAALIDEVQPSHEGAGGDGCVDTHVDHVVRHRPEVLEKVVDCVGRRGILHVRIPALIQREDSRLRVLVRREITPGEEVIGVGEQRKSRAVVEQLDSAEPREREAGRPGVPPQLHPHGGFVPQVLVHERRLQAEGDPEVARHGGGNAEIEVGESMRVPGATIEPMVSLPEYNPA